MPLKKTIINPFDHPESVVYHKQQPRRGRSIAYLNNSQDFSGFSVIRGEWGYSQDSILVANRIKAGDVAAATRPLLTWNRLPQLACTQEIMVS